MKPVTNRMKTATNGTRNVHEMSVNDVMKRECFEFSKLMRASEKFSAHQEVFVFEGWDVRRMNTTRAKTRIRTTKRNVVMRRRGVHMLNMIEPFAQAMVGKESDKMIRDIELKVKMKTLTLTGIQELLQPHRVMDKYREHATFIVDCKTPPHYHVGTKSTLT